MDRRVVALVASLGAAVFTGCGSSQNCTATPYVVTLTPASGTADHNAAPPGNQIQFSMAGTGGQIPAGCPAVGDPLAGASWKESDPTDVHITFDPEATGITRAVAVCVNATPGATTLTGTLSEGDFLTGSGTAQVTCK